MSSHLCRWLLGVLVAAVLGLSLSGCREDKPTQQGDGAPTEKAGGTGRRGIGWQ